MPSSDDEIFENVATSEEDAKSTTQQWRKCDETSDKTVVHDILLSIHRERFR